jgi:hypothetical protein
MPDNDASDFLSHQVKPIEEVLGLRAHTQLEVADGVAPVREEGRLLIHLVSVGPQHLEEPPFRLGGKGLDKAKAHARWDILLIRSGKGQDTPDTGPSCLEIPQPINSQNMQKMAVTDHRRLAFQVVRDDS